MAPLVVEPDGEAVVLVWVAEPEAEAEPDVEVVLFVVFEAVAIAAAWKAEKFFSAVGFTAKTIPLEQWLIKASVVSKDGSYGDGKGAYPV